MSILPQKNAWSSKFQSFIRIKNQRNDQKILGNTFSIKQSDSKDLVFSFDSVIAEEASGDLSPQLDRTIDLIRLGFSCSVYFNGGYKNGHDDTELKMIKNQIEKLYSGFENDERDIEDGISNGEILFSRSIKLLCYELFDNHIVDLCSPSIDATRGVETSTQKNEDNVRLLHGTVTNLIKTVCPSPVSALSIIDHAMQMRLYLSASTAIAPHEVKASDTGIPPPSRLIGAVGFIFIVVEIEQLIYIISSGKITTRESKLEYVLIPPTEVFTSKPNKHEVMKVDRSSSCSKVELITVEDVKVRNAKLLTSLQGGIQSLSALTRVINALKGDTCAGESQNPMNGSHSPTTSPPSNTKQHSLTTSIHFGASNTKQHIPYRDSLFTQLLKPSLQENCNICITTIDGTSESMASMLGFASNIGSLYNTIRINSTSKQPPAIITEEFQLKLNAFAYKTKNRAANTSINSPKGNVNSQMSVNSHINPMAAFNGVLSDFEANIDYLAHFSESFWSMDAEKERRRKHSLSTMGISCIPIHDNDDEKEKVNIDNEISYVPNQVGPKFHTDKEPKFHTDKEEEHLPDDFKTLPIHEKVDHLSSGRISPKLDKQVIQKKKSLGGSSIRRDCSDGIMAGVSASVRSSISNTRYSSHEETASAILIDGSTRSSIKSTQDTIDDGPLGLLPLLLPSPSSEEDSYYNSPSMNEQSDGNKRHNSLNDNSQGIQLPGFISPKRNSLTYKINNRIEKTEFPPVKVVRRSSDNKSNATRRPTSALGTNRKGQRTSDPTPLTAYDLQKMDQNAAQHISISHSTGKLPDAIDRKDSIYISASMNYKESSIAAAVVGSLTSFENDKNVDDKNDKYKTINIKNDINIGGKDISQDMNEGINIVSSA